MSRFSTFRCEISASRKVPIRPRNAAASNEVAVTVYERSHPPGRPAPTPDSQRDALRSDAPVVGVPLKCAVALCRSRTGPVDRPVEVIGVCDGVRL